MCGVCDDRAPHESPLRVLGLKFLRGRKEAHRFEQKVSFEKQTVKLEKSSPTLIIKTLTSVAIICHRTGLFPKLV